MAVVIFRSDVGFASLDCIVSHDVAAAMMEHIPDEQSRTVMTNLIGDGSEDTLIHVGDEQAWDALVNAYAAVAEAQR